MLSFLCRMVPALLLAASIVPSAVAQTAFPNKAVTIVVPFPPGGSMDALGRISAEKLSAVWGQPVLVDNRAGAGGLVGAQRVKGSPPDGYTLLLTNSALIQNVVGAAAANPPYDPIKDFEPVLHMTHAPVVFVVNPKLPVKNLQDFVELVKREPKKHSFGSGGVNQTLHLLGATFNEAAGLDMAHVPQKGDGPLLNDIIAGHVSGGFATIATAGPHIAGGTVRALGVVGPRSALLPDVPSFKELGYPQLDVVGWFGMFAPAGTPKPVVDRIAGDIASVLKMPDVAAKLRGMSLTPTALPPAEFGSIVKRDLGYWDTVVKKVGEK
ncbi:tripartite tricarboxylate transporter substrate binding protein [Ramlibacter henchirensis]|uniref:Tripartite tricarboxylate transporter substrate binding protein n=1 Tax=Ramlibacter henchirensis TaxID=204072 RepID=A0A4Z0BV21_9BURK|nr:tripartite tricarboxylate transporter substrate binding protein [Ramlibacter henchirensis]TFZ02562.1 tripartite tricarboxylate transporter substrate binding protein [Ramlibacter henchirensis]